MSRAFITGRVAIDSMRDNGYKNTAYAVAELIDNSIQAGANRVDLICIEDNSMSQGGNRRIKRVEEIIILDNGVGMSPETLHFALEFGASKNREDAHGMGKFGMGLPNSSISQCKRVEVWSWTKPGEYNFTYLDIDEMKNGGLEVIPEVTFRDIPAYIANSLPDDISDTGTLIKWSKLDKMIWSTSKSIKKHSEDLVGRMYRDFINQGKSNIWFHSFLNAGIGERTSEKFKANDPLYLSKDTSLPLLPDNFKNETFFEIVDKAEIIVPYNGKQHKVVITSSAVKQDIFDYIRQLTAQKVGGTDWGKHCARNHGVSVVRAGRELELKTDFFPLTLRDKGRFMGIEVSFPPGLDEVFGVTNNKQHAVNFENINREQDAINAGFENSQDEGSAVKQYMADLEENNDPKFHIYNVVDAVNNAINHIDKNNFKTLNFGNVDRSSGLSSSSLAVSLQATSATNHRIEKGHGVISDDEQLTESTAKELFKAHGFSDDEADKNAKVVIEDKLKFFIEKRSMPGDIFFDVSTKGGLSLLLINSNHPFAEKLMNDLDEKEHNMLSLTLAAWARMECEASSLGKEKLRNARVRWGEMLSDFLPDPDAVD